MLLDRRWSQHDARANIQEMPFTLLPSRRIATFATLTRRAPELRQAQMSATQMLRRDLAPAAYAAAPYRRAVSRVTDIAALMPARCGVAPLCMLRHATPPFFLRIFACCGALFFRRVKKTFRARRAMRRCCAENMYAAAQYAECLQRVDCRLSRLLTFIRATVIEYITSSCSLYYVITLF